MVNDGWPFLVSLLLCRLLTFSGSFGPSTVGYTSLLSSCLLVLLSNPERDKGRGEEKIKREGNEDGCWGTSVKVAKRLTASSSFNNHNDSFFFNIFYLPRSLSLFHLLVIRK